MRVKEARTTQRAIPELVAVRDRMHKRLPAHRCSKIEKQQHMKKKTIPKSAITCQAREIIELRKLFKHRWWHACISWIILKMFAKDMHIRFQHWSFQGQCWVFGACSAVQSYFLTHNWYVWHFSLYNVSCLFNIVTLHAAKIRYVRLIPCHCGCI